MFLKCKIESSVLALEDVTPGNNLKSIDVD